MITLPVPTPPNVRASEHERGPCAPGEIVDAIDSLATSSPDGSAGGVLRSGTLTVLCQAVSSATSFLRMVLLARCCTDEQVGLFSMAMTPILMLFSSHERLIESSYLVYAYRRSGEAARRWLGNSLTISLSFTTAVTLLITLAALACLAAGTWGGVEAGRPLGLALLASALVTIPIVFREFARAVSFAHFDLRSATVIDVLTFVLQLGMLGACWATDTLNVFTSFLAMGLSSLAAGLWWVSVWQGKWDFAPAELRSDWWEMWGFSKWLVAARVMGQGSRFIMPWIVWYFLSAGDAGVLATCITLVGLSWIFVRGINNYFRPVAVQAFLSGGAPAVRRAVMLTSWVFVLLLGALCGLYAVAGSQLFGLVYGDAPANVGLVVLLLGVNSLLTSLAVAATNGLAAIERPQGNLWIEGLTFAVTLTCAVTLTPRFGLPGASWAMLLGDLAGAGLAFWLLERELGKLRIAEVVE